ncbi:MAG TPA: TraR/DksA C4-type zinc finger protein [Beutenbergiaceae bacterium]|nr:TraR/DksA C4-type zinc finger protein [Beutenbergiaceae bacterium]
MTSTKHDHDPTTDGGRAPTATPESVRPHLEEIRAQLEADRQRTLNRIAALGENVTSIVEATRDTATDDEHDPEGSTIAFERSQADALRSSAHQHLVEVDAAVARIEEDAYGRCEDCGEPIAFERLLARPTARTCISCAAKR